MLCVRWDLVWVVYLVHSLLYGGRECRYSCFLPSCVDSGDCCVQFFVRCRLLGQHLQNLQLSGWIVVGGYYVVLCMQSR